MGTWSEKIDGNDTFYDVYTQFFSLYNEGSQAKKVAEKILYDINESECDIDERHNSLFALALAQWETKCLDETLYTKVKEIIENGENLKFWKDEGVDDKVLKKREKTLILFLKKLSEEKPKAKRRVKPKLEFSTIELVNIISPDKTKKFQVSKEYTNGEYIHTGSMLSWATGGGAGIAYYLDEDKDVSATWLDSNNLQIEHNSSIHFIKKEIQSSFFNDVVNITYKENNH